MMGYRKLPFGYQIKLGEVVVNPAEAKLVDDIFHWYIGGDSYSVLVKKLREQPVRYSEGKPWNKNMVARILEDKRYRGIEDFPMIISSEILIRAQEKRSAKQVPIQKTPEQKLLRQLSGNTATEQMERQVLDLLNGISRPPRADHGVSFRQEDIFHSSASAGVGDDLGAAAYQRGGGQTADLCRRR